MNISPRITRLLGSSLAQVQKHSPIILTTVGVAGVITAGVMAARATLKLEDTVDLANQRLEHAQVTEASKTKAVVANVTDLVKLYGPSVTLGAVSLVCIVSAQGILHKRNAALVVAYKGLEQTYRNYRARVVEEYGEDVDRKFHLNLREETIEDKDGKKVTVLTPSNEGAYGEYTFIYGPDNPNWVGTHEFNDFFLQKQEDILNDLLRLRGHVTLNDALDKLGFARTKAGMVTGWVYKPDANGKHQGPGDGYITFRRESLDTPHAADLEWGERGSWLLDFNVDGTIWDKI